MSKNKIAVIFGGTGFIGRQIVQHLARAQYRIKVITRVPESAFFLKPYGDVGQIVPVACHYNDAEDLNGVIKGADVVVNTIGILFETKKQRFQKIHSDLPAAIAKACSDQKVSRFVHLSALGVEENLSIYAKTKLMGEKAVFSNFPDATILRPSVVFGEDDEFFNMFAALAQILPALPLIGGGHTKFQPVYVGDIADAVMATLKKTKSKGKIYALGGPEILSFKEIYNKLFEYTGQKRALISLPFALAKIEAFVFEKLPTGKPLLTRDQVVSLRFDNIINAGDLTLEDLGIDPTSLDLILPQYLEIYRKGGRFAKA